MKTVYFVLGMHRSGTSAITGTINRLGLDIGNDLMPITKDNPKGYFENNKVLHLNEKILAENNSKWDDCHFRASNISKENKDKYVAEAKKILKEEFRYAKQFCIKDPRNCLTFPIWEQASLELNIEIKVILPYRNPIEVASSLKKRDSFSFEKSLILWSHHFLSAELFSRVHKRIFISFNELLNDTKKTINNLNEFLAIKNNSKNLKEIEKFLDVSIKHNYFSLDNITIDIPSFLQKLFSLLAESKFSKTELIDEIRNDFYYSLEMFQFNEVLEEIETKDNEIKSLKKHISMLEKISENCYLDTSYYLEKNPDLSGYSNDELKKHYFEYGKQEGRIPNLYCEILKIDVKSKKSNQEIIYFQNIQNDQYQKEVLSFENKVNQLIQEQDSSIIVKQEIEKELTEEYEKSKSLEHNLKQSLEEIKNLQQKLVNTENVFSNESNKYEKQLKSKDDELHLINEIQKKSLAEIKNLEKLLKSKDDELNLINEEQKKSFERIQNFEKQLKCKQDDLNLINEQQAKSLDKILLLEKQISEIKQDLNEANTIIYNKNQNTQAIEKQNLDLSERLKTEIKKYSELDTQFNDAIEEISKIKECACWVYTKPFRVIKEKLTKGK